MNDKEIIKEERDVQRMKPWFKFSWARYNADAEERTPVFSLKRLRNLFTFDPNTTRPGLRSGHGGQFKKAIARRRRHNQIARRSRRVNRMRA